MNCSCADLRGAAGRWRRLWIGALLVALLGGCATERLPKLVQPPSHTLVADPDAPLAAIAGEIGLGPTDSGAWPLVQASFALDARVAAIRNARRSIDLQSYLIGDDSVGRLILRELRQAALRGVRVRVLVDDLYTIDLDRLLLGLAATPNVEVRLFNPFFTSRNSTFRRLFALAANFRRLNHRMHNKLMVADGVVAVVGGRNLADEYFLRGASGNFIDFDVLLTGAVVKDLGGWFDVYWNSEQVYGVADIVRGVEGELPPPEALQAEFDRVTQDASPAAVQGPPPTDFFDQPPFSAWLAQHRYHFLRAGAASFADSPNKIDRGKYGLPVDDTLTHRFLAALGEAKSEVLMLSPYFIPGDEAMARLRQLRQSNVRVAVVTNSLAVSDEPLVSIRFERHQIELLKMGVELFELSSTRLKLDSSLRTLLGSSTGRLHAKIAFLDRSAVFVGSMNLDPRSSSINTEIGVRIDSPDLAKMIIAAFRIDAMLGVYQVKLNPDGRSVRWTAVNDGATQEVEIDPDTSLWQRLHLVLLSLFVPEKEL